jgi:TPR repeat protein
MAPTQRLKKLLKQAANGCAESQFLVSECFREGKEGAIDNDPQHIQMAKWYLQAAQQGHVEAQAMAGAIYRVRYDAFAERGDEKRMEEAAKLSFQWFLKAGKAGFAEACYNLGDLYEDGIGVPEPNI